MAREVSDPMARFDAQYIPEPTSGCWLWLGELRRNGYGTLLIKEDDKWRHKLAHRLSYEWHVGTIPPSFVIDHKCRTRCCVNPDHLRLVSCRENLLLGETLAAANAAKTHCCRGHEFSAENIFWKKNGARRCRECGRQDVRRRRARNRQ